MNDMQGDTLVVAGASARVLAESAVRGGWQVIACDLYGDLDTRRASRSWLPIGDAAGERIDASRLRSALAVAAREPGVVGWVAGGGFEGDASLLDAGAEALPRLGMGGDVVAAVRDMPHFFATLDRLGLDHPAVVFSAPARPTGWLVKSAAGTAGLHIRHAELRHPAPAGAYWQREQPGQPMSALFLADGRQARLVGLNRLIVRPLAYRPYVYAGAIGPVEAPVLRERIEEALARLVPAFGLRGLASLDFIACGRDACLLEINPRPSASMALYDRDWPQGLLRAHLQALQGRLPAAVPATTVRGEQVVHPRQRGRVDAGCLAAMAGVGAVHDVPAAGITVAALAPLCSVSACAGDADAVQRLLDARQARVLAAWRPLQEAA